MQKLYIPWSFQWPWLSSQVYHWKNLFPGSKATFTKYKCMTSVPPQDSENVNFCMWKRGHMVTLLQLWSQKMLDAIGAPRCLWPFLGFSLGFCVLAFTSQCTPLSSGPGSWSHCWECQVPGATAPGWPLANEGWYRNAKAQLLPLRKHKLRGVVSILERPRPIKQKLGLCRKSLLPLVLPLPQPVSTTPPPVSLGNPSFIYCGPES